MGEDKNLMDLVEEEVKKSEKLNGLYESEQKDFQKDKKDMKSNDSINKDNKKQKQKKKETTPSNHLVVKDEIDSYIENFDKDISEILGEDTKEKGKVLNTSYIVSDSKESLKAIGMAASLTRMKHGIYAYIPILCHGAECPYANVCKVQRVGLAPEGDQCPIEIAMISDLYDKYTKEFEVEEDDIVDITMIRNLISVDVQISRAIKRQAVESDIVSDVTIGISETGQVITKPEINKSYELLDNLFKARERRLRLLSATRKDKLEAGQNEKLDASQLIGMMKERLDKFEGDVIDIDMDNLTDDDMDNLNEEDIVIEEEN